MFQNRGLPIYKENEYNIEQVFMHELIPHISLLIINIYDK